MIGSISRCPSYSFKFRLIMCSCQIHQFSIRVAFVSILSSQSTQLLPLPKDRPSCVIRKSCLTTEGPSDPTRTRRQFDFLCSLTPLSLTSSLDMTAFSTYDRNILTTCFTCFLQMGQRSHCLEHSTQAHTCPQSKNKASISLP